VLPLLYIGIADDRPIGSYDNPGVRIQVEGRGGPQGLHILQGDILPAKLLDIVQFYQVMHGLQVVHRWAP
jgi:hypothetical protein